MRASIALIQELHEVCEALAPDLEKVDQLMRLTRIRTIPVRDRLFERGRFGGVTVQYLPRRVWRDPALGRRS